MDSAIADLSDEILRLYALNPLWTGAKLQAFGAYYLNRDPWSLRREIYDHLVQNNRNLFNVPMGHGKSTSGPETMVVAFPCFERDIRMLVVSEAAPRATKIAMFGRDHLEFNPRIKRDFGEMRGREWRKAQWIVSGRDPRISHPTCRAAGIDTRELGRYDTIIMDDIISMHNSQTWHMQERTMNWLNVQVMTRLDRDLHKGWPYGTISVWSNHFHPRDYITHLKEKTQAAGVMDSELEAFAVFERSAYTDAARTQIMHKDFMTHAKLDQMKLDLGPTMFELAVMNNPSGLANLPFPEKYNMYWTRDPRRVVPGKIVLLPPMRELRKSVGWDLGGPDIGNDLTFGSVLGYHQKSGGHYWLDFIYGNWETYELYEQVYQVYKDWGPQRMNMEAVSQQRRIVDAILIQYPDLARILVGIPVGTDKSKETRLIDGLQATHRNRKHFFPETQDPRITEAIMWFNQFPGARYKDGPDSMEMAGRDLDKLSAMAPRSPGLAVG